VSEQEVEHPDEMPVEERAEELDADELPQISSLVELPRDAEVPEETKGT